MGKYYRFRNRDEGASRNTHNKRSLIRTSPVCHRRRTAGRNLKVEEYKHTHADTHTHKHTHTHTHTQHKNHLDKIDEKVKTFTNNRTELSELIKKWIDISVRNDKCIEEVWKKNINDIKKSYGKDKDTTNKTRDHNNKQNTEEIIEESNDTKFRAR